MNLEFDREYVKKIKYIVEYMTCDLCLLVF